MNDRFGVLLLPVVETTVQHLELTLLALGFSLLIAIPVIVLLFFLPRFQTSLMYFLSLLYAIPSFALFALLIPVTGLGRTTAIVVLVLYSQYILVRTCLTGLNQVDQHLVEVGEGLGMTAWQIFWKIQLPLAKSSFFVAVKLTCLSLVALATIASTIHAGGLGVLLFEGLRTNHLSKLLIGMALIIGVSLLLTLLVSLLEYLFKQKYERS